VTGNSELIALKAEREIQARWPKISRRGALALSWCLGVQRQAAAVSVLLGFLRLGILAFEVGKRHVQRFMTVTLSVLLCAIRSA
jgi:hypothetical protein